MCRAPAVACASIPGPARAPGLPLRLGSEVVAQQATPQRTAPLATGWPAAACQARLHWVSGKGGTGKSTVAAALALALAASRRRVLLVEVEARQSIAHLFDLPPLPATETRIASAENGGEVFGLALDIEHAFSEYLDMFYKLGFAGRAMRRMGAVEFVTTIAPGLRDVILTGKVKECVIRTDERGRRVYDAVVVDAPPTGRITTFLDVTKAVADLARGGPIAAQADNVARLLHSDQSVIHLVTQLEALPVQETADAVAELRAAEFPLGSIVVNRTTSEEITRIPALEDCAAQSANDSAAERKKDFAAETANDSAAVTLGGCAAVTTLRNDLLTAGIRLSDTDFQGLLTEITEYVATMSAHRENTNHLRSIAAPRLSLPTLTEGIDLGGLYELAGHLAEQGVR